MEHAIPLAAARLERYLECPEPLWPEFYSQFLNAAPAERPELTRGHLRRYEADPVVTPEFLRMIMTVNFCPPRAIDSVTQGLSPFMVIPFIAPVAASEHLRATQRFPRLQSPH